MSNISLKEYAKQKNISYEAVRQQVNRYAEDLENHIVKDGKQQLLDEEAVAFLDAKRKKNPAAIYQAEKDETINQLEEENKNLFIELVSTQKELIIAQKENRRLIDQSAKIALLEVDNEAAKKKAAAAEEEAETLRCVADLTAQERDMAIERAEAAEAEAAAAKAELEAFRALPWYKKIFKKDFNNERKDK